MAQNTRFTLLVCSGLLISVMAVQYSPMERLDFALKWESARLSYFESLGWKSKVKEQNSKIDQIQYELNRLHNVS